MSNIKYAEAMEYNDRRLELVEDSREFATLVAFWQEHHGLLVDGQYGPKTESSVRATPYAEAPKPVKPPEPAPITFDGPLSKRPGTVAELNAAYGDPTRGGLYLKVADPVWKKAHLVTVEPGTLPLVNREGDGRYVTVNEAMLPYLVEGLSRARDANFRLSGGNPANMTGGPLYRVGGFNFRRMRHDTPERAKAEGRPLRPLSRHSWGAAVDIDADNNAAKEFAAGRTPVPWSAEWTAVWPRGLQPWFVEAMESVGFRWGGRWQGFCDPMHWELCGGSGIPL